MKVKEIMTSPAITANEDDSLEQCARKMLELRIDQLPVVNDDGTLTGFISASDFIAKKTTVSFSRTEILELFGQWFDQGKIEKIYEDAGRITVKEVMSSPAISIGPDASVKDVFEELAGTGFHSVVVVEKEKPVGLVSVSDFLKLIVG